MNTERSLVTLAAVLAAALFAIPAAAQSYPSKVVRLIVPYPPAGSVDVVARTIQQPLSKALGQTVVVENRPGANASLGTEHVVRAAPDGHTVLVGGSVSNAALRSKLPYDLLKDLTPVVGVGTQSYVFSVHPSVPVKNVKELVALARARPGELVYSINIYGGGQHLSGELLKQLTRIDMKPVVFQGGGPSAMAVIGGHAGILISTVAPMIQHVAAGKLRPLAITSRERSALLPDLPTMIESGFPDFEMTAAMAIWVPSATPKEPIDRLGADLMRLLQTPEVKAVAARDGYVVAPISGAEYGVVVRKMFAHYQKIGKAANIKLD
jgi:tripartite-type tricarboxylate transporter receptor subunit TctC